MRSQLLSLVVATATLAAPASAQLVAAGPFVNNQFQIHQVDEVTGLATSISPTLAINTISGMTSIDDRLLAANGQVLFEIDPGAGTVTPLWDFSAVYPTLNEGAIAADPSGTHVYLISGPTFGRVELATGVVEIIQPNTFLVDWSGLTFLPDGRLFGLGLNGSFTRLYEIDPANGAVTDIGPLGVPNSTPGQPSVAGLAFNPDLQALYALYDGDLYRVNFFNGAAVLLGDTQLASVSGLAYLTGPPPCPPDLAEPFGTLDIFDVLAFLDIWNSGDEPADYNNDGNVNVFDILDYLGDWNEGCP